MDKEILKKQMVQKAREGKLSCYQAFKLAEEAGCSLKDMGELANELGIKIAACQLGCF